MNAEKPTPLRLLIVEDNAADAELVVRNLRKAGYAPVWERVDTEPEYLGHLSADLDLIVSDSEMPQFTAMRALELLQTRGLKLPFIIVSGTIREDTAVEAIRRGAADYLLKDRMARLGSAVRQALEQVELRREREQAETALRRSEEDFRLLFANNPMPMWVCDLETRRFLAVNEAAIARYGYSQSEFLGLMIDDLREPMLDTSPRAGEPAGSPGSGALGIWRHRAKDGRQLVVEITSHGMRFQGREAELALVEDVTQQRESERALRESEARFRQIAENINEVFWIVDQDPVRPVYVSPAYETLWGRTCESLYAAPGAWLASVHPEDRARIEEAVRTKQVLGTYHETYRIVRPDATVRWVRDRAFPLRDGAGRVFRVVGIAEDITEVRLLEEQFRQAQKLEAIGTLAGGIAHDFNNILAAIMGFSELIKIQGPAHPETIARVEDILAASHRAADLVRQILTFSRREKRERRPVQLRHLVRESLNLLRATLPTTIEFQTDLAPDTAPVLAEPSQIHQILMNLGTNAWHAMGDRPGRLGVKLGNFTATAAFAEKVSEMHAGQYVHLAVSDTGKGMDRATLEHIFEPFFTTKETGAGTGLGLSVVHGIVHSHNGVITVSSDPGRGTVFDLYFPALKDEEVPTAGAAAALPRGRGERILLVDDEEVIVRLNRILLVRLGYEVVGFTVVAAALEFLRRDPGVFDLLLTDQTMPLMSGLEFAREAHALRPELRILLATGLSGNLDPEQLRKAGIAEVLAKPADAETMATAVRRTIDSRRMSLG